VGINREDALVDRAGPREERRIGALCGRCQGKDDRRAARQQAWPEIHGSDSCSGTLWHGLSGSRADKPRLDCPDRALSFQQRVAARPPALRSAAATTEGVLVATAHPNAFIVALLTRASASMGSARSFRWTKIGRSSSSGSTTRRGFPVSRCARSSFRLPRRSAARWPATGVDTRRTGLPWILRRRSMRADLPSGCRRARGTPSGCRPAARPPGC